MMGVAGALEQANCSDVKLPSSEGGAVDAGISRVKKESTAGDIGIFGGGVGGMGECFFALWIV